MSTVKSARNLRNWSKKIINLWRAESDPQCEYFEGSKPIQEITAITFLHRNVCMNMVWIKLTGANFRAQPFLVGQIESTSHFLMGRDYWYQSGAWSYLVGPLDRTKPLAEITGPNTLSVWCCKFDVVTPNILLKNSKPFGFVRQAVCFA